MTAIGFMVAVTGYAISWFNDYRTFGAWANIAGVMVLVGGLVMLAGIGIKLWEVMP